MIAKLRLYVAYPDIVTGSSAVVILSLRTINKNVTEVGKRFGALNQLFACLQTIDMNTSRDQGWGRLIVVEAMVDRRGRYWAQTFYEEGVSPPQWRGGVWGLWSLPVLFSFRDSISLSFYHQSFSFLFRFRFF